jgi:hypothetical protein
MLSRFNITPFSVLFLFPEELLTLLVRRTIVPQKEIDVKIGTNETLKVVDNETRCFG